MLCFLYLGMLYSWGVLQAELAKNSWVTSLLLGMIGSTAAFCLAFGCLPVRSCVWSYTESQAIWVLDKIGPAKTAILGVLGGSVALAGSGSCTQSFGGLLVLQGITFGSFGSLIYLVSAGVLRDAVERDTTKRLPENRPRIRFQVNSSTDEGDWQRV